MIIDWVVRWSFFSICLAGIFLVGAVRSHPFYGKIDFLMLDGRPWWPAWRQIVDETRRRGGQPVYTDYITGYVLASVFGEKVLLRVGSLDRYPVLSVPDMEKGVVADTKTVNNSLMLSVSKGEFSCVINLLGYTSSWVPDETKHWRREIAETGRWYRFDTHAWPKDLDQRSQCVIYGNITRGN